VEVGTMVEVPSAVTTGKNVSAGSGGVETQLDNNNERSRHNFTFNFAFMMFTPKES
jgi:hypothetical protein